MADFFEQIREPCPLPVGTRVQLVDMPDDPAPVPVGTLGTVTGGNGGQIWVSWDNGARLALIPGEDRWLVIRCAHGGLAHGETCPVCFWERPSADDEYNERLKRETEQAIAQHPNTYRGR